MTAPAGLRGMFHALTVRCDHCAGSVRRPFTRAEAETVAVLTAEWQSVEAIRAQLRSPIKATAVANRLTSLAKNGQAESKPADNGTRGNLWRRNP